MNKKFINFLCFLWILLCIPIPYGGMGINNLVFSHFNIKMFEKDLIGLLITCLFIFLRVRGSDGEENKYVSAEFIALSVIILGWLILLLDDVGFLRYLLKIGII